jgi:hypothetical protein
MVLPTSPSHCSAPQPLLCALKARAILAWGKPGPPTLAMRSYRGTEHDRTGWPANSLR